MASKTQTLKFKRVVNAPPAEVYRAFTNSTALRDWLCDAARVDARKGGQVYLWWNDGYHATGKFTTLAPGRKVAFTWRGYDEPGESSVQVSLAGKNGGTVMTLTHAGLGSGKVWADTVKSLADSWPDKLENLQSVLETGIDLRVARLPRMGVFIDDFNAEIAAQLGAPVSEGIRLAGVADGTGAQAAGLQKDDVLVKLGGNKVFDFPSLGNALQGHKAGDKVPIIFYRGGKKMTTQMELSQRPIPQVPPLAELIEIVRKNYVELDVELAKLVEGLSEAQAAHRPAPDSWSIMETIAHFIACERDFQSWVAQMLNDREVGDSLEFRPNVTQRIRAIVERFATLPALLDELKRSEAETVNLLAALPAEFVARKHLYQRAALWMTQSVPSHFRDEHFGLLQAAIQAAQRDASS